MIECSEELAFRVTKIVEDLVFPWSMAFLPDGRVLVVERPGRLRLVQDKIGGLPVVTDGLPPVINMLDVAIVASNANTIVFLLSYTSASHGGTRLNVLRGELTDGRVVGSRVIFSSSIERFGMPQTGGRLLPLADGTVLISVGDAPEPASASQDLTSTLGKVVRLGTDDFTSALHTVLHRQVAHRTVYSYGLRNVQGLALDNASGVMWATDHGPDGGDELNTLEEGANFGWPQKSEGARLRVVTSVGAEISDAARAPIATWTPAIAPSGLAVYRGRAFKQWNGNLFVGSLSQRHLRRVVIADERVVHEEKLLLQLRERIRDVREAPDGNLYVLTDSVIGSGIQPCPRFG